MTTFGNLKDLDLLTHSGPESESECNSFPTNFQTLNVYPKFQNVGTFVYSLLQHNIF